ncbi:hypothetical protein P7K49_032649 [Saguinus oedipus]|uniref:Uncharacterized protein n=1 Tax=Saguinus oedipus TaxID=9490 RepID=A0ABQ9TYV3_SAGOE|nr:hypothetical protein P7K49_032649 [Saguinus oedipus]
MKGHSGVRRARSWGRHQVIHSSRLWSPLQVPSRSCSWSSPPCVPGILGTYSQSSSRMRPCPVLPIASATSGRGLSSKVSARLGTDGCLHGLHTEGGVVGSARAGGWGALTALYQEGGGEKHFALLT